MAMTSFNKEKYFILDAMMELKNTLEKLNIKPENYLTMYFNKCNDAHNQYIELN